MELYSDSSFDAILKKQDGEIIAEGYADINIHNRYVTFFSDFVPLYPIDTKMEIVRMYKGKEVHRFRGTVYLSDKQLMRLVDVKDKLLEGSELCYSDRVKVNALITPLFEYKQSKKFSLSFLRKEPEIDNRLNGEVVSLTPDELVFSFDDLLHVNTDMQIETGYKFDIKLKNIKKIENFVVEVKKSMLFGEKPAYICDIRDMDEEQRKLLVNYLHQYNLKHNKVF